MASKVKRVVGIVLIAVAALIAVVFIVSGSRTATNKSGYTPIDQITGIYADAKLKPGCIIKSGDAFAGQDFIHINYSLGPIISIIKGESSDQSGYDARDIQIIDVYGDKCTIIFFCDDDPGHVGLFICDNYPLANLEYDPLEVFLANDLIRTELYGTGYTIQGAPSSHFPRIVLLTIPLFAVTGVILLFVSLKQDKRKKQE